MSRDGEQVRLREATYADAALLDRWESDPAYWLGEYNDFGLKRARSYADVLRAGNRLVSVDRGKVLVERLADRAIIGDVSWHPVHYGPNTASTSWSIGISLAPEARGHGYGVEAQQLIARMLLDTTDVARVEASTDVGNVAEQRALEKAGFLREGVLRQAQFRGDTWHDMVMYSFVRDDLESGRG